MNTPPRRRRGSPARWLALAALALPAASLLGGCHHHVRLAFPDTTHGTQLLCKVPEAKDGAKSTDYACQPASVVTPDLAERSGTTLVVLPRECKGMFNEVLIRNADTGSPEVWVTCAPPSAGVQPMD